MSAARRALVLPVVLVLIGLMALMMAGFVFFVRAEVAGIRAHADGQQARVAAESGLEEFVAVYRVLKHDVTAWFDRPDLFRHALVWAETYDRESDPVREASSRREFLRDNGRPVAAWRYSIVAARLDDPLGLPRFGPTPESSKLNINAATDEQIANLLTPLLTDLGVENPLQLVAALLDWRDGDDEPNDDGAENEYYNQLEPAYNAKNGPLDTIEELLLVRGFSAAILWGEDTNRNGYLDENEDDLDASFPYYDNGDGTLNHGIAPYLTVYSRELDTALDNKPRINLNNNVAAITAMIAEQFPEGGISDGLVGYITQLKGQNFNFGSISSPAMLYTEGLEEDEDDPNAGSALPQELLGSPVTAEDLPVLMDRFSTRPAQQAAQPLPGLININTAPARVLALLPGMGPDEVSAIVEGRLALDAETLKTTAWPVTAGLIPTSVFHQIAPYITTKSHQLHVEVLGYSDQVPLTRRFEWVVEMVGPLPQVLYHRELTSLGVSWRLDQETLSESGR